MEAFSTILNLKPPPKAASGNPRAPSSPVPLPSTPIFEDLLKSKTRSEKSTEEEPVERVDAPSKSNSSSQVLFGDQIIPLVTTYNTSPPSEPPPGTEKDSSPLATASKEQETISGLQTSSESSPGSETRTNQLQNSSAPYQPTSPEQPRISTPFKESSTLKGTVLQLNPASFQQIEKTSLGLENSLGAGTLPMELFQKTASGIMPDNVSSSLNLNVQAQASLDEKVFRLPTLSSEKAFSATEQQIKPQSDGQFAGQQHLNKSNSSTFTLSAQQTTSVTAANQSISSSETNQTAFSQVVHPAETIQTTSLQTAFEPGKVPFAEGTSRQNTPIQTAYEPDRLAESHNSSATSQIVAKINLMHKGGRTSIHLQLMPEELGKIEIRLTTTAQGVGVVLTADSSSTEKVLDSQLKDLRQHLSDAGIEVTNLSIGKEEMEQQLAEQHYHPQNKPAAAQTAVITDEPQIIYVLTESGIDCRI